MRTRSKVTNVRKGGESPANPTLFEYPPQTLNDEIASDVIIFTQHDHKQLQSPRFLNDTIISFFMQYHLDQKVIPELKSCTHVFNSFFFSKIKSFNHNSNGTQLSYVQASRWLKSVKIFSKDFLIMPLCENDHWLLIIICYPANNPSRDSYKIPDEELYEPAVIVLNSCAGLTPKFKKPLGQWLKYRWQQEHGTARNFSINQAKRHGVKLFFPDLPQQKNSYNCGVYLLGYFYSFLNDPRQAYISIFRGRSMKSWFQDNKIDISRERSRMITIVRNQITSWNNSGVVQEKQQHSCSPQERSQDSQLLSDSSDIIEDGEFNKPGHQVIVIH